MKKLAIISSLLLLATAAQAKNADELTGGGTSAEEKGQAIAKELGARNTGWKDLGAEVSMTLKDSGGSEAQRKFRIKVLERPDAQSGDWLMVTFDAPADVKGTAVLSHAKVEGDDEQWLYLPASKRTKRVSSSNKTGSFAGSEFSFEDLAAGDGRKYTWKYLGNAACGSLTCMSVEATPKDSSSAYSRRVLAIDTAEMRVQSIDFFDKKNTKAKTLTYTGYEKVDGKFWRAKGWSMINLQSGKSTVLTFGTIKMNNGYSTSDFGATKLGD